MNGFDVLPHAGNVGVAQVLTISIGAALAEPSGHQYAVGISQRIGCSECLIFSRCAADRDRAGRRIIHIRNRRGLSGTGGPEPVPLPHDIGKTKANRPMLDEQQAPPHGALSGDAEPSI